MVPFPGPAQHGREVYGLPLTVRLHGPSAAENALCARQATATVLHACAGEGMARRSHQGVWAVPNGVMPPFCSLSAATVIRPPQSTPAQAGQGATDARNEPSARVVLRTGRRGCEQRAKCTIDM